MTTVGLIFVLALGALFAFLFWEEFIVPALAAATREGGDAKQAPCGASQSGGSASERNAQPSSPSPPSSDNSNV